MPTWLAILCGATTGAALAIAALLYWPQPPEPQTKVVKIDIPPLADPLIRARLDLAAVARERDGAQLGLRDLQAERDQLRNTLNRLAREVARLEAQRRAALGDADARAAEVVRLSEELRALRESQGQAELAFRSFVENHTSALVEVLNGTGVDVAPLLERATEDLSGDLGGQGGPLLPLDDSSVASPFAVPVLSQLPAPGTTERLALLERILQTVPLFAPLDVEYRTTSGFGPRRDPFNRRKALHTGLDFVAARGSPIVATAAGTVVRAGRMGAYGLVVEIDHGLGFSTLYAHLRKIDVRKGQTVEARQRIGVIGSTGRSTGLHLHYEVRFEDRPLDPMRFLHAGRALLRLIAGEGGDPAKLLRSSPASAPAVPVGVAKPARRS